MFKKLALAALVAFSCGTAVVSFASPAAAIQIGSFDEADGYFGR